MLKRCRRVGLLLVMISFVWALLLAPASADHPQRIYTDEEDDLIHVDPIPVPEEHNNPWPQDWEDAFWERANRAIEKIGNERPRGGTWGENEKNYYPRAMFNFLAGNRDRALRALEETDVQADSHHAHTKGIDLYWTFTLKGQVRKYFFFGPWLDEDYKDKMTEAARIWTEKDPTEREHPEFGTGSGEYGYGPEQRGYWVDRRGTDNMRAMRDGSIYLFAEATGNEEVRQIAKQRIQDYVVMLYHVGMKEWDSPNYHGHTLAPYHNIYDFAEDPEVRKLAKAALDWLYTAGALKYWHGGFGGGAMSRHHGGGSYGVFRASPVHPLYLYVGDTMKPNPSHDRDDVHHITSPYRPPQAVVKLAQKQFDRPVEMFSTKPAYTNWKPGEDFEPRFWETMFIGETFQMGSAVSERYEQVWAIAPFSLMAVNSERGVDYFIARSDPMPGNSRKNPGDQIGQYRNLMVWLRPQDEDHPEFHFLSAASAALEDEDGIWFWEYEDTYLAVRPINLGQRQETELDEDATDRYPDEAFHHAAIEDEYGGFALEVGERGEYDNFDAFKSAVLENSSLDTDRVDEGIVELTGADGHTLRLGFNEDQDMPRVYRDGERHIWEDHKDLYKPVDTDGPVSLGWKEGTLRVKAGDHEFTSTVTQDGEVSFENRPAGD